MQEREQLLLPHFVHNERWRFSTACLQVNTLADNAVANEPQTIELFAPSRHARNVMSMNGEDLEVFVGGIKRDLLTFFFFFFHRPTTSAINCSSRFFPECSATEIEFYERELFAFCVIRMTRRGVLMTAIDLFLLITRCRTASLLSIFARAL
jgi:hypothetical protein